MRGPRPDLVQRYGTGDVLASKIAGQLPLLERVGMGLLNAGIGHHVVKSHAEQREQAAALNAIGRLEERERLAPTTRALEHTRAPVFIGRGFLDPAMYPVGLDEGMVRLAYIAKASGRALAKLGSIGGLVAGGAVAGGALLGYKGVKKGVNVLQQQEAKPKNFGAGNFQMPFATNEYGHPQQGTPLI